MRLTAYEEYMLRDDRIAYPMVFGMLYKFRGHPDIVRLQNATHKALQRHPLLTARVTLRNGKYCWDATPVEELPSSAIEITEEPGFPSIRHIDIFKECGVRLQARLADTGFQLFIQVHHTACDGLGQAIFLADLLTIYAGREADLPQLDAGLLAHRAGTSRSFVHALAQLPKLVFHLFGNLEYFFRQTVSIIPVSGAYQSGDSPCYGQPSKSRGTYLIHRFTPKDTGEILHLIRSRYRTTLTTFVLTQLHRTIATWRLENLSSAKPRQTIRISVPVSLRKDFHRHMPVANTLSMVLVDHWHFASPSNFGFLLSSNRLYLGMVKKLRLGVIFPQTLAILRTIPPSGRTLQRVLDNLSRPSTAVLSNLGQYLADCQLPRNSEGRLIADDILLECIDGIGPLRPTTQLSLGVYTYANRLNLSLSYDSDYLSVQQVSTILERLIAFINIDLGRTVEVPTREKAKDLCH